jgi:hypothetical protein
MKAVVKAVLLDPEARQADDPSKAGTTSGKVREPFQQTMAIWRGLACNKLPTDIDGNANLNTEQAPFNPETVFSFYAPTDTASGTDILAPEQRLLNAQEFNTRLGQMSGLNWSPILREDEDPNALSLGAAGCDVSGFLTAYRTSPTAFQDYLAARFFRGAMPATLRLELTRIHKELQGKNYLNELAKASSLMQYALLSPYFGAIR